MARRAPPSATGKRDLQRGRKDLLQTGGSSRYSLQRGTPIANDRSLTPADSSFNNASVLMLVDAGDFPSSTALVPSRPRRDKNVPLL
jgi:hypothetical protein